MYKNVVCCLGTKIVTGAKISPFFADRAAAGTAFQRIQYYFVHLSARLEHARRLKAVALARVGLMRSKRFTAPQKVVGRKNVRDGSKRG